MTKFASDPTWAGWLMSRLILAVPGIIVGAMCAGIAARLHALSGMILLGAAVTYFGWDYICSPAESYRFQPGVGAVPLRLGSLLSGASAPVTAMILIYLLTPSSPTLKV